jgi:VanZ family protein
MRSSWRVLLWAYAPLILWVGVIFFMSSPEASAEETSRIIGPLLHYFFPDISPQAEALIHFYVRKTAHFTEYGALAFLGLRACSLSSPGFLRGWRYVLPLLLVAVVASLDEFNQSFEPSRTSSVWDVLLDCSGAVAMLAFCSLIKRPKLPESPA